MKSISPEYQAALAARRLRARDFFWLVARERDTGDPVTVGFWSGLDNVSAPVVDPDTGGTSDRDWYGVGALISISDIPSVIGVTVNNITVRMDQMDEQVNEAIRTYDCKMAVVQVFRGLFDPDTAQLVAPAEPLFVGFIDQVTINTPSEGEVGYVELTCASHTQELLRANPATRSHQDQITRRSATDNFFADVAVVGDWGPMQWGPKQESVQPEKPKGLLGWGNFLGFL